MARVRRGQENGLGDGRSTAVLRERAQLELEQERRQTKKAMMDEPDPTPSTPE